MAEMFRYAEVVLIGQIIVGLCGTIFLPSKVVFKGITTIFLVYAGWFGWKYVYPFVSLVMMKMVLQ